MSKKVKDLKWESVAIEGFPISMTDNFQGFVGLEECTEYGFEKDKKFKKKTKQKKRKLPASQEKSAIPSKKVKLSNGFVVESCNTVTPSITNEVQETTKKNKKKKLKNKKAKHDNIEIKGRTVKKTKLKLGENINEINNLTPEDMLPWAEFKLPESIMKALTEMGFKEPTKIQQLTLPAAIHGRRDILGAAETGSGKTLAFGLPILTGIIKLKEKASAGFDVYDLPYKKTAGKKKPKEVPVTSKKEEGKKKRFKKTKVITSKKEVKESSEDGYSSGDESSEENSNEDETELEKVINDDDYLEEIEVPIRKRDSSADEGNDSDSDENYTHLSEMYDSDDLADSTDDNKSDNESDAHSNKEEEDEINNSGVKREDGDSETESVDSEQESVDEATITDNVEEDSKGIGCVKVIDDIQIPGHVVVKTGKPLYALILTPTRELAIQISRHLISAAKYTGIKVATIIGGMAAVKQERVLRSGPEVVVATPGRLWELIGQGQPHLQQLDCVKFLAIDETDRMIERGHFDELYPLLERLNADETKRSYRQNFVFSATLTMVHELPTHMKGKKVTKNGKILNRKMQRMTSQQKIKRLVDMIGMTDPKVVDITEQNLGTAETLTESRIACSREDKDAFLYYIIKRHPGRTIVFCNSIGSVKRLAQMFTLLKCRPLPLHASMQQRQRLKNLEKFRDDPHGVLVATDVAARGLDIPNVDHVIHYQVPRTAENYVHRSGRTARANKEGLTILMMEPKEAHLYGKLCRTLNKTADVPVFPIALHAVSPFKETVGVARDMEALAMRKRRTVQANGWRDRAAREMDMIIDDDDVPVSKMDPTIDKALQAKKRHLDAMLSRPLFPKGFSYKYPSSNDPGMFKPPEENALQVMKQALETGEVKKQKRKSKNASLFELAKKFKK